MFSSPSHTSWMLNSSIRTCILPASILARSRMSLMRLSKPFPAGLDVASPSAAACRSAGCSDSSTSLKPRMLLSGVRSSWLMVARKSLLSRFDSYSAMLAWASSSTLRSRSALTLRQRSCMLTRLRSMRLKAWLRSSNSSPVWISLRHVQLAGGDGVADLLEVLDRLDDHVADDEIAAAHDQQGGDQGRGDEHRPVPVDAVLDGVGGHADLDDGHEVVFSAGRRRLPARLRCADDRPGSDWSARIAP